MVHLIIQLIMISLPAVWTACLPASMSALKTEVLIGEDVNLTCGRNLSANLHMYLCRNGRPKTMELVGMSGYAFFQINSVSKNDYGEYSCMYSHTKENPTSACQHAEHSVTLRIYDYFEVIHPARISQTIALGIVGKDVVLNCSFDNAGTDTWPCSTCDMHLCRDGVGIDMVSLNHTRYAVFTIRNITLASSGAFSCVYSNVSYQHACLKRDGLNTIFPRVYDDHNWKVNVVRMVLSVVVLIGIIVLAASRFLQVQDFMVGRFKPSSTVNKPLT